LSGAAQESNVLEPSVAEQPSSPRSAECAPACCSDFGAAGLDPSAPVATSWASAERAKALSFPNQEHVQQPLQVPPGALRAAA